MLELGILSKCNFTFVFLYQSGLVLRNMKILIVTSERYFCLRGICLRLMQIIAALQDAGHSVDLLCSGGGDESSSAHGEILRVRIPAVFDLPWIRNAIMGIWAVCRCMRCKYDVVQAHNDTAWVGVMLKKVCGIKFIYALDAECGGLPRKGIWATLLHPILSWRRASERCAIMHADVILTSSGSFSGDARKIAPGISVAQVESAPLQKSFQPDQIGAERLRREFAVGANRVVVYTGSFDRCQGIDLLLRAARQVTERMPDVRFVLVGGEDEQVERMKTLALRLDMAGVCFFTGERPLDEIPAFMTLADVLVAPRIAGDHLAVKILTYMQSERPLVATRCAAHTQVLDDSCAVLVLPQAMEVAEGILQVIREPLLSAGLGREARSRISADYSLASFRHKIRNVYQGLQ